MKKIVLFNEVKGIITQISAKKTVLVGGCFDLLHYGHLKFLKNAKKTGEFLIIALESDEFIKKYKDRNPIHNQEQRAEIISSLDFVDLVIMLPLLKSDKEYFDLIRLIKPKLIAVTEGDPQFQNKKKQANAIKADVKVVTNLIKNFSTKEIIKKIL